MRTPQWMLLLWSGIYFVILLSLYTPFSILTISFIMIPGVVIYSHVGHKRFLLYYGIPLLLVLALLQTIGLVAIIISLFFLAPTIMIGEHYRRGTPARTILLMGTMTIVGQFLLLLIGASAFGFQPIQEINQYLWDSYHTLPEVFRTGAAEETMELTITLATKMIPLFMVITGAFYVAVTHALGGRILRQTGVKAPALPPVRKWMLPKSLVWYYLVFMILDMVMKKDLNSMLTMVILNGFMLLGIAFAVQAISFLSFIGYRRRGGVLFPIFGVIMYLFMPGIVSLLGVLDVVFPIRKSIKNR